MPLTYKQLNQNQKIIFQELYGPYQARSINRIQVAMLGQTPEVRETIAKKHAEVIVNSLRDESYFSVEKGENDFDSEELKDPDHPYNLRAEKLLQLQKLVHKENKYDEFWKYLEIEVKKSILEHFDETIVKDSLKKQLIAFAFFTGEVTQHYQHYFKNNIKETARFYENYNLNNNSIALADIDHWCKQFKPERRYFPPVIEKETCLVAFVIGAILWANYYTSLTPESTLAELSLLDYLGLRYINSIKKVELLIIGKH